MIKAFYAMGSAYGGLAARFLLQRIEGTAQLLWSESTARQEKGTQL
jgi:hypothetical protein